MRITITRYFLKNAILINEAKADKISVNIDQHPVGFYWKITPVQTLLLISYIIGRRAFCLLARRQHELSLVGFGFVDYGKL